MIHPPSGDGRATPIGCCPQKLGEQPNDFGPNLLGNLLPSRAMGAGTEQVGALFPAAVWSHQHLRWRATDDADLVARPGRQRRCGARPEASATPPDIHKPPPV